MPQPVKLLDETYFEGCTMEDDLIDVGAQSYGTTEEELDMLLNQPIAATLHVPVGCKDIYASADVWKNFTTIVDDLTGTPSGIPEYLSPLTPHPSPLYTLDGKLVPSQLSNAQGIYILKSVDKTYKTRIRQ